MPPKSQSPVNRVSFRNVGQTQDELGHWKSLSPDKKRLLRRFECKWCGQSLGTRGCGAIHEKCSEQDRIERRDLCIKDNAFRPLQEELIEMDQEMRRNGQIFHPSPTEAHEIFKRYGVPGSKITDSQWIRGYCVRCWAALRTNGDLEGFCGDCGERHVPPAKTALTPRQISGCRNTGA